MGTINAGILLAVSSGRVDDLPVMLLAQAYTLPILFGVLSQTISYRRVKSALAIGLAR